MDELDEAVALLNDAPAEFRKDAAGRVIGVVSDYENWLSHGEPPVEDWWLIKRLMHPRMKEGSWRHKVTLQLLEYHERTRRRARER